MSEYDEIKKLAIAAQDELVAWADAGKPWPIWFRQMMDMRQALTPDVVLKIISENNRLMSALECARGDLRQAMQIVECDSKDAERYRFIRDDTSKGRSDICIIKKDWEARMDDYLTLDKADLVIDAAIEMERN